MIVDPEKGFPEITVLIEEVVRDEICEALAKGGIPPPRRYRSASGVSLVCVGRRVIILREIDAGALSRAYSTIDVHYGGGRCLAPPSRRE